MKKTFFYLLMLIAASGVFAQTQRTQASFTPGNIVIYRVGDGIAANLANTGNPVFLDEYTAAGVFVQSIALPTTVSGSNKQLIASGTATSEGLLTRSADGSSLVLTGYASNLGGATNLTTSSSATINRTIGIVDFNGVINTTTTLTDAATGSNPRSAAMGLNGTDLWITGGAGGVRYTTLGSTTSTQINTGANALTNARQLHIFSSQLFLSTGTGVAVRVGAIGAGTPITAGQNTSNLAGLPTSGSPYSFFFADLNAGVAGDDVLYVTDDVAGSITKYSFVAGSWTSNGTITASQVRGVCGLVNGTTVTLFGTAGGSIASGGGSLYKFIDNTGYNGAVSGAVTTIATASANTAFRGIAIAPVDPCVTPSIQASNIIFTGTGTSGTTGNLSWTNGSGSKRVLVMNTINSFTDPADGPEFLVFSPVYAGGEQVVYVGNGNSQSISGLTPNTLYYFRVYEYNCTAPNAKYNTAAANLNPASGLSYKDEATADFLSSGAGTGNYSDPASWLYNYTGILYQAATQPPGITNNATIQNGHTISLTAPAAANGLTLQTTGNIILGNNNLDINSASGGSATGHIQTNGTGALTINNIGASDIVFPVGPGASLYHPVTINNAGVPDNFSVNESSVSAPACLPPATSVIETWNISEALAGGSNCTLRFDYTGAVAGGGYSFTGGQIVHCNGASADYHNGTATATVATGTGFTSFSPFGITADPLILPVNFSDLRASRHGSGINVEWSNLTETSIVNYSVERSATGQSFVTLGTVNAGSNNGGKADYMYFDALPIRGVNYYRINSLGTNGEHKFSSIVKVNTIAGPTEITIYPNPVTTAEISLHASDLQKGEYTVRIVNAIGQELFSKRWLHNGGAFTEPLQLPYKMKAGVYCLQLSSSEISFTKTFIIQ